MKTICLINRKGGVGKTTTAANLGHALLKKGNRVLLVDLDSQANLTGYTQAKPQAKGVFEIMTGENTVLEATLTHSKDTWGIRPGSESVATLESFQGLKPDTLRNALKEVEDRFDFCIIDTAAQLGKVTICALTAADLLIIPVGNGADDHLQGVGKLLQPFYKVKEAANPGLEVAGILVNDYDTRTPSYSKDLLQNADSLAKALSFRRFDTVIRHRSAISKAKSQGKTIFGYDPKDPAAEDFRALADELLSIINAEE